MAIQVELGSEFYQLLISMCSLFKTKTTLIMALITNPKNNYGNDL